MRHLIPLTLSTIIVAGAAYVAVNAHHDYTHQLTVQNARTAAAKAEANIQAELAAHKQAEASDAKLAANQKGCEEGLAAYGLLTTSQKSHVVKPVCPL